MLFGAILMAALAATPAFAGSQVVTGDDEHCSSPDEPYCDYTRKVIDYVRNGSPDPAKPILAITCGDVEWIEDAYDDPDPDIVKICPPGGGPGGEAVTEADYASTVFSTDNYSAILVGDGEADNGVLNARKSDFKAYFDQGGGIATFDSFGDQEDTDFLPLPITLLEGEGNFPYQVTEQGRDALGITNEEVNDDCCQHETYANPGAGDPLQIGMVEGTEANNDALGALQTPSVRANLLFGRVDRRAPVSASTGCANSTQVAVSVTDERNGSGPGSVRYTIDGGGEQTADTDANGNALVTVGSGQHTVAFRGVDKAGNAEANANSVTVTCSQPPQAAGPPARAADTSRPRASVAGVRSSCVRRAFQIRLTARDGGGLARVVAKRDGRHLVNRAFSATTRASFTLVVKVRGLRAGRHTIAVTARDTSGNRVTLTRTFRVCAAQRPAPRFTG